VYVDEDEHASDLIFACQHQASAKTCEIRCDRDNPEISHGVAYHRILKMLLANRDKQASMNMSKWLSTYLKFLQKSCQARKKGIFLCFSLLVPSSSLGVTRTVGSLLFSLTVD